jgi:GNAT superfamily N-acetyltransferase
MQPDGPAQPPSRVTVAEVDRHTWPDLERLFQARAGPKACRGHGLMTNLLTSAIAHARQRGAAILAAYPVDPDSPSYRFMGFVPTFEAHGFTEVGRAGTRRHVLRLNLGPDAGS